MADTLTANLKLKKPDQNDSWKTSVDFNWDLLDTLFQDLDYTDANIPASNLTITSNTADFALKLANAGAGVEIDAPTIQVNNLTSDASSDLTLNSNTDNIVMTDGTNAMGTWSVVAGTTTFASSQTTLDFTATNIKLTASTLITLASDINVDTILSNSVSGFVLKADAGVDIFPDFDGFAGTILKIRHVDIAVDEITVESTIALKLIATNIALVPTGILRLVSVGEMIVDSTANIRMFPDSDGDVSMTLFLTGDGSNNMTLISTGTDDLFIISSNAGIAIKPDFDGFPGTILNITHDVVTFNKLLINSSISLTIDSDANMAFIADSQMTFTGGAAEMQLTSDANIRFAPDADVDSTMTMLLTGDGSDTMTLISTGVNDLFTIASNAGITIQPDFDGFPGTKLNITHDTPTFNKILINSSISLTFDSDANMAFIADSQITLTGGAAEMQLTTGANIRLTPDSDGDATMTLLLNGDGANTMLLLSTGTDDLFKIASNAKMQIHPDNDGASTKFILADVEAVSGESIMQMGSVQLKETITAPGTLAGFATIYVDTANVIKIKFADGTVKTFTTT